MMTDDIAPIVEKLSKKPRLFSENLIGLEKENLRMAYQGGISQTEHPHAFGSALTHKFITTDFSEALIEVVTPPFKNIASLLDFLFKTQQYIYHHLPETQNLWPQSMPCITRGKTSVPIAHYGNSNLGRMKTVYREGLANRYGSIMQAIAGVHFNYSFGAKFWRTYQKIKKMRCPARDFIDHQYMALIRNIERFGWMMPYLFGASPAVCLSFLQDYHEHSLVAFDDTTLFEPHATSLRMGDIGYQNLREDALGVKANYNSLRHYLTSIGAAMQTSAPEYEKIGLKKRGRYQQLNTHILQIENEYYGFARPKPGAERVEKPLQALAKNGVHYIELRSLDLNPLLPLGIDETQIRFLEVFLSFCLLENSPPISTSEQFAIDENLSRVAHEGRKRHLMLQDRERTISLANWGRQIIRKMRTVATLFGKKHERAVGEIARRFDDISKTPSAQILAYMKNKKRGFFAATKALGVDYKNFFLAQNIDHAHFQMLDDEAQKSRRKQKKIEQSDTLSFDDFLDDYFSA